MVFFSYIISYYHSFLGLCKGGECTKYYNCCEYCCAVFQCWSWVWNLVRMTSQYRSALCLSALLREMLLVCSWSNVLGRIHRERSLNLPQVPAETHPVLLPAVYLPCQEQNPELRRSFQADVFSAVPLLLPFFMTEKICREHILENGIKLTRSCCIATFLGPSRNG